MEILIRLPFSSSSLVKQYLASTKRIAADTNKVAQQKKAQTILTIHAQKVI